MSAPSKKAKMPLHFSLFLARLLSSQHVGDQAGPVVSKGELRLVLSALSVFGVVESERLGQFDVAAPECIVKEA